MHIQRLNMDNTWLLQLNKLRILVDPWLEGAEIDYFPWFNKQWHRTAPMPIKDIPAFDYVLITQKYPDHFHPQTLLKIQAKNIIAPASIEKELKKLLPQASIMSMGIKNPNVQIDGIDIQWYPTARKIDPIYDAFMISDSTESVFLATHGYFIGKESINIKSTIQLLICPFNHYQLPFYLGGTVSPGLEGLMHLAEKLNPKYIVSTHDEDKHAEGLVSKMAKVKKIFSADLAAYPIFDQRILEINHYSPVAL